MGATFFVKVGVCADRLHAKSKDVNNLAILKNILQSELHLPHGPVGGRDAPEIGTRQRSIWQTPHRMIQDVERFPTELKLVTFLDAEILVRGEIKAEPRGAWNGVPA